MKAFVALCRRYAKGGTYNFCDSDGRPSIMEGIEPGHDAFYPKEMRDRRGPTGRTEVEVYGKYENGVPQRFALEEGRIAVSPFKQLYDSSSPSFKRKLAVALNESLGVMHPIQKFVNKAVDDYDGLYRAVHEVLNRCSDNQLGDQFEMEVNDSESDRLSDVSAVKEYFNNLVENGWVDLDRATMLDDRYCAFKTVHFVYPYVGGGTKEFEISGMCVSDLRFGTPVTRMERRGVGDDDTFVFAGEGEADMRRVPALHDSFKSIFEGTALPDSAGDSTKEALVNIVIRDTEANLYRVRGLRPADGESLTDYRARFDEALGAGLERCLKKTQELARSVPGFRDAYFDAVVKSDPLLRERFGKELEKVTAMAAAPLKERKAFKFKIN